MKIGYYGDGPWAHKAFQKLVSDNTLEIKYVTVRFDTKDQVLINLAEKFGIPIELSSNINSDEFLNRVQKYGVDLLVSMSFNQIFKSKIINSVSQKIINCHAGKLPFYRGRNILNWALINDEKEFGITVHYVDEGIDTGDIILQRLFPITDDDDYCTILEKAYKECANILYDAIKLMQSGRANRIKQSTIDPIGMYCGVRGSGDEVIDWNLPSRQIFNFVRAICRPGPMAETHLNGSILKINKVREFPFARSYIGKPGQILGKTKEGFYVKTQDSFVEVLEYDYKGKIRVGDRMV